MEIERPRNIHRKTVKIEPFQGPTPIDIPRRPHRSPASKQLHDLFKNRHNMEIIHQTGFRSGPVSKRSGYSLAAWSLLAAFIDGLILISLSCVFLLVFSVVAKQIQLPLVATKIFVIIYLLCMCVYMTSLRVFAGHTIGEWACDLRLGQPHERIKARYAGQVVLRVALVMFTGLIAMPVLSLLFRKDIAGKLTGLHLFSLK